MDETPKSDDGESERRSIAGLLRRERRVTPRLAEPTLRVVFSQFIVLCRVWTGFAVLFVVAEVLSNFILPETRWARTLFYCVVVGVVTYAAERLRLSVVRYLNSESVGKSVHVFQDALILSFVFVVLAIVFGLAHLVNVY